MPSMGSVTNNITGVIVGIIAAVVFLVVGITLGDTVITYFSYINATALEGVEMASILVLFAGYAPFFYYLALVGGSIAMLVGSIKYGKQ